MKNNELIAEFMCVPQGSHTHFMIEPFALESYADVDDLKYDISWDWLMPVANEIIRSRDENNADWDLTILEDALTTTNIGLVYNAVVDFITNEEYKKTFRHTAYHSPRLL
tara:strand:- start:144 stop:473 length:330 start_codon:yes stop_codon:yes gene_type:complete